ncbi:cupin domain-containing protein [Aquabacterium lacunae]|uniref:Cupin domain-containing protein n=2 Tax=Aquabacterium lacunae TaxID=2528630 RepID=A0A4Q9H5I5_9BURK|nr:cupin domain-containing protein [Aquabacterium lacunae]
MSTTPRRSVPTARSTAATAQDPLQQPTELLGGLSPAAFMKRHWQKKPLLIRQAVPGVKPPIDRKALFDLAGRDDVESRLIVQAAGPGAGQGVAKGKATADWRLKHGPLARRSLPPMTQPNWTLLVQGLDLHVPAAHELLSRFRFVPDARLDDLMISYATDGGGVGPHFDSYDVFLLQVHGQRKWRIGRLKDDTLVPRKPLKILQNFECEQEWVLEPGDMLYLPPRWAHDGIAQGECMTCSIGFRVPEAHGLAAELLVRIAEGLDTDQRSLYKDPQQPATAEPGRMPADLQAFAADAVARALKDPAQVLAALGEVMTEPKPKVWFDIADVLPEGAGLVLHPATRMMYDDHRIYCNGESWRAAGADARLLRRLADQRALSAADVARASTAVRDLLDQFCEDGWVLPSA